MLSGSASDKMIGDFEAKKIAYNGPFNSLEELLSTLKADLQKSESSEKVQVVVFSPGATSFGMFKNEFDRGNQFKANVKKFFG